MTTTPPPDVAEDLKSISNALDEQLPPPAESNLLIGTWNIRAFSDLTEKWHADEDDSPKRDWHAMACIAEIVSRFDVVAVQETRRNVTALQYLMELLGDQWRFITSDVTEGDAGNGERLTYVYNTTRVQPSGLVGEIVLPPSTEGPVEQFARTPYTASFLRGNVEFSLTTVHVLWGNDPEERLPELTNFAQWMRNWVEREGQWNENLLVLGDFNLDRKDDPLYEAFTSTGLQPAPELNGVPRTIFNNDNSGHFYDQIAWFGNEDGSNLLKSLDYTGQAGHFDFLPHAFDDMTNNQISWRISDHYPLWTEFKI
ncbi:endonuclease/exonuclease/phosphatase family protein [Arthrobacter sp. H14]|uniref:endonuclease/exonuclease/phosphatase family protein n=1 Tax=Arthrobacter sp. H14 TaxID=1312959 RepID=UPI000683F98F|nr:endonuclease/exonuclease/phosphatase family protein [Arthrobacter sp. H14]